MQPVTSSPPAELNGLTFYAVGRNTEVHHIEVYNNQDDAFEWFGGTVCAKNLVAMGCRRRHLRQRLRLPRQEPVPARRAARSGRLQDPESGASDKGMEMDGYESVAASGSLLFSASLWGNVTLIGTEYTGNGKRNIALSMRDNAAPQIFNSVFMDFGSVATMIENRTDSTGNGITLNVAERFGTPYTNYPAWTALNADERSGESLLLSGAGPQQTGLHPRFGVLEHHLRAASYAAGRLGPQDGLPPGSIRQRARALVRQHGLLVLRLAAPV